MLHLVHELHDFGDLLEVFLLARSQRVLLE
jgi:hypothetical protein